MRVFHMILRADATARPRRIDFTAEGPDHAFQVARNEPDGTGVELWDGEALLARMTRTGANIWKLHAFEKVELQPESDRASSNIVPILSPMERSNSRPNGKIHHNMG